MEYGTQAIRQKWHKHRITYMVTHWQVCMNHICQPSSFLILPNHPQSAQATETHRSLHIMTPIRGTGTPVHWKGVQVLHTLPSRLPVRLLVTTEPHLVDAASMNHGEHLPRMTRLCYSIIR